MKYLIQLILALLILSSCAHFTGEDNQAKPIYQITQIDNPRANRMAGGGKIKISYEDYDQAKLIADEKIKNEMLSPKDSKTLLESIPKGGYIHVNIFRTTVDTGNLKMFTYILMKNDKEVLRQEGGSYTSAVNTVPNTPSQTGLDGIYWTNSDIVPLHDSIKTGEAIKLFAIDKMGGRDEFTISLKDANKSK